MSLRAKYRKRTRTVTCAVEECYLRDDVACGSELCETCAPTGTSSSSLAADARFIMIPDERTFSEFLELFELPELSNYIVLGSELRKVPAEHAA